MSPRRKLKRIIATIAALALGICIQIPISASAAGSFNAINQTINMLRGDDDDDDDEKSPEVYVDPTMLDDVFGEVVYYRWDRVYENDYPKDNRWHISMLVWPRDDGKIDDGYLGALAPDDIWMGPEAKPVDGVTHSFPRDDPIYKKYFKGNGSISEGGTYYIRLTDRAEGLDVGSDPQVQVFRDTFYTNDDRDCLYVKYGARDDDNDGVDDNSAPVYMIKMSKRADVKRDYIIQPGPDSDSDESWIKFRDDEYGYGWTFKSKRIKNAGLIWHIFHNVDDDSDANLAVGPGRRFLTARSDDDDHGYYKWFIGTKLRFSAITQDVSVNAGQLLSISASNYISSDGEDESQSGVILPGGNTITVEKGGILSISGDFINNGTIINNGGTIIVQNGGTIYPFLQGDDYNTLGCGSIKCNSGDIIVEKGGTIYTGMNCALGEDNVKQSAVFWLDNSSTLINYGTLAFGQLDMGEASTIENRSGSYMYSCLYDKNWDTFVDQLSDNNGKLSSGSTDNLRCLGYVMDGDKYTGGIKILNGPVKLTNVPTIYYAPDAKEHIKNPDANWQDMVNQGLIDFGELEL